MRQDVHRPSVINPADYEFIAFEYLKVEDLGDAAFLIGQRVLIRNHMAETGGTYSRHAHGGSCHVCGAHALYTALFHHKPSNSYIRTGLDCAEKLECLADGEAFRRQVHTVLEARAGKRKAQAILEQAGLQDAWSLFTKYTESDSETRTEAEWPREETTVVDIVFKLVKYGNLSEKQVSFVRSLLHRINNREAIAAERTAQAEAAKPVPVMEGRMTVEGTVLSIRVPKPYSDDQTWRWLVLHDDGWKVWGTMPKDAIRAVTRCQKGTRVRFDAAVKRSNRDEKFGYYSRPTKFSIVGIDT